MAPPNTSMRDDAPALRDEAGSDLRPEEKPVGTRYFEAYGCERDPFSDDGISGLFFAGGQRGNVVEELMHACRFTRSPILLSGRQGCGKTTVLREFQQRIQGTVDIAVVAVELMQPEQQILEGTLRAFGQPVTEDKSYFEQLVAWVAVQASRQRHVVLCFDNADHLGEAFLRSFFELAQHTDGHFFLVFSGAPDLESKLDALLKRHDFTLNHMSLVGFGEEQVSEYASYRLRAAGYSGELPFTDIQVKAAQRRSDGSVAYLNDLLRSMLEAGGRSHHSVNFRFPKLHAAAVVLLLLIVFAIAVRNQPDIENREAITPPLRLETVNAVDDGLDPAAEVEPNRADEGIESIEELQEVDVAASQGSGAANSAESSSGLEAGDVGVQQASLALQGLASEVLAANSVPGRHAEPSDNLLREQVIDEQAISRSEAQDEAASEVIPDVIEVPVESAIVSRLRDWPETGYALQVFGTHNAQRAKQLVADFSADADLLFYETLHNGKAWFVVVAGPYSGRQTAQSGISTLPDSLQRLRPWPRNIASIKGDIERYRLIQKRNLN